MTKGRLVIISATPMYRKGERVYVFEPTLREIEEVASLFSEVIWLGFKFDTNIPEDARCDRTGMIRFITFPAVLGGRKFFQKLRILKELPSLVAEIIRQIEFAHIVHTRAPSLPALIALLLSFFYRQKSYWHKYAGNWVEKSPPLSYSIQRFLLQRLSTSFVTINGCWPTQPLHIHGFENPCFSIGELGRYNRSGSNKAFDSKLVISFVGALLPAKGALRLLQALLLLSHSSRIASVIIVGDGPERQKLEQIATRLPWNVIFTGRLPREGVREIYLQSHVIVLPTDNEGFPKVIAEAAAFGCIPVVSNVSAIGQYIQNGENGFLLNDTLPETIARVLMDVVSSNQLKRISINAIELGPLFTYERYRDRIEKELT
ncbi:MAG: glycosyltransferase family 4 protein [Cyclobacteriaceae bacterium]|nr:glycosyltransferase family 4 protein [Cyclobacteriaceae bacterium]